MTRRIVGLGIAALVVLGAAVAATSARDADVDDAKTAAGAGGEEMAVGDEAGAGGGGSTAGAPVVAEPRVVRRASIRLAVDGLAAAFDRAASVAGGLGGFVESSTSSEGAASLTLRVPAARFDEARRSLARLGEVEEAELSGRDVTGQLVDHEARLRSLAAQEEALRTLLGRAEAVGEILEVQARLFDVRQQIEQLDAQRARLADAADLATITVAFAVPGAASSASGDAESPFERAWEGTVAVAGGMVVVVGYALPFGVLALLGWLVWLAGSRRTRRVAAGA